MTRVSVTARPEYEDYLRAPTRTALVLATGLLSAVVLYCSGMALEKSYQPAIFCSPFFVGAIVGLFSYRNPVRGSIYTMLVALAVAVLTLREGVVCCLMALPFVLPITILGAVCGSTLRRYVRGRRALAALWSLLMLTAVTWQAIEGALDEPPHHPLHRAASAIVIDAPPERVFAALTSRDLEVRADWPWFLRIGLPMPSRLHVDRPGDGGSVTGTFSQGVARGHVTEWVPNRALAYSIDRYEIVDLPFHITRLGRSPSYGLRAERVEDWLTIVSTRFDLRPLPSGATELRREIVWRRHLAPALYFGWLQQTIIQRGQDRLLALIRERVTGDRGDDGALIAGVAP
jgi:uncharacterized protein YndB with AHSA1/START domain